MTWTQTEIVGAARNYLQLLVENWALLLGLGLNLEEIKQIVTAKLETAEEANARQERQKVELRETTKEVEESHDALWRATSGYLDAVMGAVGKGTPTAKIFQRLRSRIRMPQEPGETVAPVEPAERKVG